VVVVLLLQPEGLLSLGQPVGRLERRRGPAEAT
jgi:hypothetical protein